MIANPPVVAGRRRRRLRAWVRICPRVRVCVRIRPFDCGTLYIVTVGRSLRGTRLARHA